MENPRQPTKQVEQRPAKPVSQAEIDEALEDVAKWPQPNPLRDHLRGIRDATEANAQALAAQYRFYLGADMTTEATEAAPELVNLWRQRRAAIEQLKQWESDSVEKSKPGGVPRVEAE